VLSLRAKHGTGVQTYRGTGFRAKPEHSAEVCPPLWPRSRPHRGFNSPLRAVNCKVAISARVPTRRFCSEASGAQLLLDGVPREGSPAENSSPSCFRPRGSRASISILHHSEEVAKIWQRHFPPERPSRRKLAQQLKIAMEDVQGIRVNEVCFVATDSRLKDATSVCSAARRCVDRRR